LAADVAHAMSDRDVGRLADAREAACLALPPGPCGASQAALAAARVAQAAAEASAVEWRNPRAAGLAGAGFREMAVGFIPRKKDCARTEGWSTLGLGFPFFHAPVHVHGLRDAAAAARQAGEQGGAPDLVLAHSAAVEL
jgi:hypothetical protein